jgi:hypothetical protein
MHLLLNVKPCLAIEKTTMGLDMTIVLSLVWLQAKWKNYMLFIKSEILLSTQLG